MTGIFAMDPESNEIIMRILGNITVIPDEPEPEAPHYTIVGDRIFKNGIECARGKDASCNGDKFQTPEGLNTNVQSIRF